MLFNSVSFLIFFVGVTLAYFLLPHRFRWFFLLLASCFFYMSEIPLHILILFLIIFIDYLAAIIIEKSNGRKRLAFFVICIILTCSILFLFKYFNFFNENIYKLAELLNWNYSIKYLSLVLPIGISFLTFQSLSYVIEVYKGNQKVEKNFGIYSLYVMFFPQLVAGPIERPQNLLHQFYEKHCFDFQQIVEGLKLMLWGFFLKVVVADRLALIVNPIYNYSANYTGMNLLIPTLLFPFQLFCDFAGYSTIAVGIGLVLGFKLTNNFNRPFISKSISEFWNRWHISLSSWFRDYIYKPMLGNTISKKRLYFSLFTMFLIIGLWHGANWTFIILGGLHGIYMVISVMTFDLRAKVSEKLKLDKIPRISNALRIVFIFFLVTVSFVFFRANSLSDAFYILTHIFTNLHFYFRGLAFARKDLLISLFFIILMEFVFFINDHEEKKRWFNKLPKLVRWAIYMVFILFILLFGVFNNTKFIYFQF